MFSRQVGQQQKSVGPGELHRLVERGATIAKALAPARRPSSRSSCKAAAADPRSTEKAATPPPRGSTIRCAPGRAAGRQNSPSPLRGRRLRRLRPSCCRRRFRRPVAAGRRPSSRSGPGVSARRLGAGQRRRRRQHDGRHRHRQLARGRHHRQLRHQRHDLRLRGEAGRRSAGRDRRLLRFDQPLAAAALHDERDRRHRDGARDSSAGPREVRGRGGARRPRARRPAAAAVFRGRAHAERAGRHGRLVRREPEDLRGRPLRPRRDGRRDAGHELRPAPAGGARRQGPTQIRVTGGGAKSKVWRQIMADVFGVPVVAMVEDEGAALGGALQAAWAVAGGKAQITDFTDGVVALDESTRCRPTGRRSPATVNSRRCRTG